MFEDFLLATLLFVFYFSLFSTTLIPQRVDASEENVDISSEEGIEELFNHMAVSGYCGSQGLFKEEDVNVEQSTENLPQKDAPVEQSASNLLLKTDVSEEQSTENLLLETDVSEEQSTENLLQEDIISVHDMEEISSSANNGLEVLEQTTAQLSQTVENMPTPQGSIYGIDVEKLNVKKTRKLASFMKIKQRIEGKQKRKEQLQQEILIQLKNMEVEKQDEVAEFISNLG